jgi:PKD repeat protein
MKRIDLMRRTYLNTKTRWMLLVAAAIALAALAMTTTRLNKVQAQGPSGPSPASATLSTSHRSITYNDPTGSSPNPSHLANGKPICTVPGSCSTFTLTVDSSVGTPAAGYDPTQFQIFIDESWALGVNDYDTFIEDSGGNLIATNTSSADPETITLPTTLPAGVYSIILEMATGAPQAYTGTVTLQPKPVESSICKPPANCAPARYQNYPAPPGMGDNAGEPSIGVDWNPNVASLKHDKVNTGGVAFFTSGPNELRSSFDDCSSPAKNKWEDVSAVTTQQAPLSDPIGFVDHYGAQPAPGRVFTIDLLGGQGDSAGSFSDDDGNTYKPGGNGGPGQGPDHETLGGGPYNNNATPPPPPHPLYPNAIYYCSQNIVGEAECSRSDNGGQTFGPGIPIFNPATCTGGIHGHVKVAPDGTVYVPNSSCGSPGAAGAARSTDNGLTWTEVGVPGSTGSQDPSIGIGQNNVGRPTGKPSNTIYLGWVSGDGHAHVADSHDQGATWEHDTDAGTPFGVQHAVFPVVVAGDDNRAAFGFLGTGPAVSIPGMGTCDPYGATLNCANIWHLYVSTTYDGGANWVTIDATPNDPVQTGTVCLQGTLCAGGRNLLDFNDVTVDAEGRALLAYADGCVNCNNTFQGQSNSSHATIARQSGGRRLFSAFDPPEPSVPAAPQMISAVQGTPGLPPGSVLITWLEPDNGGSPITGYKIYRGTTSGGETHLADVSGETTTKYVDLSPPHTPNVFYYAQAVNLVGEGTHCGEVGLSMGVDTGNACKFPYLTVDPAGSAGTTPTDPTMGELTIENVNIGEPFTSCTDNSITFLMKVRTLDPGNTGMAVLPPNSAWQILFGVKDTLGNPETLYVELDTFSPDTPATPAVSIGRRDACSAGCGTLDTGTCTASATSTCSLISATENAAGDIIIKLNAGSPINFPAPGSPGTGNAFTWDGSKPGTVLGTGTKITGDTILFVGAGAGFLETVQTTSGGTYTREGNVACNAARPVAMLTANPMQGKAPLAVNFDASGSHLSTGECGTLKTYTLNYGDGSPPVSQSSPTFMHTYQNPGDYPARLTVTDSNGLVSTNVAQLEIHVVQPHQSPVAVLKATPVSGNTFLTVSFDDSASSETEPGNKISNYFLDFGDGSATSQNGPTTISHIYQRGGVYTAKLTVTDAYREKSIPATIQITVSGHIYGDGSVDAANNFHFSFDVNSLMAGHLTFQDKVAGITLTATSFTSYQGSGGSDNGGVNFTGKGTLQDGRQVTFTVQAAASDVNNTDTFSIVVKDSTGNVLSSHSGKAATGDIEYAP